MGQIEEIIMAQKKRLGLPEEKYNPDNRSYLLDYQDNLIETMDEIHKKQYGQGSGGELDGTMPKMASVRSSSAMTFNLLGNRMVRFYDNDFRISAGEYAVTYEKQMYTLGCNGNPANLDAFLECGENVVFCEMKMLEWFGKSRYALDDKYRDKKNYFLDDGYDVFHSLVEKIENENFQRYDAWQMFKHTLAIFNALMQTEPDRHKDKYFNELRSLGLAGRFKDVLLANIVYMVAEGEFESKRSQSFYVKQEKQELRECRRFFEIMLAKENGLTELFEKHCGVSFGIDMICTRDFLKMQGKENDNRLFRYWKLS